MGVFVHWNADPEEVMMELRIEPISDATLENWQHVHNVIIPAAALSLAEVQERAKRNRLEVAYADDLLVGCSTLRPPLGDSTTATMIVRILEAFRRRGYGEAYYRHMLAQVPALGAKTLETIVWEPNIDGLKFARKCGFVEVDRYFPPEGGAPFITLRLEP